MCDLRVKDEAKTDFEAEARRSSRDWSQCYETDAKSKVTVTITILQLLQFWP